MPCGSGCPAGRGRPGRRLGAARTVRPGRRWRIPAACMPSRSGRRPARWRRWRGLTRLSGSWSVRGGPRPVRRAPSWRALACLARSRERQRPAARRRRWWRQPVLWRRWGRCRPGVCGRPRGPPHVLEAVRSWPPSHGRGVFPSRRRARCRRRAGPMLVCRASVCAAWSVSGRVRSCRRRTTALCGPWACAARRCNPRRRRCVRARSAAAPARRAHAGAARSRAHWSLRLLRHEHEAAGSLDRCAPGRAGRRRAGRRLSRSALRARAHGPR